MKKNNLHILLFPFFLLIFSSVVAQQDPQYTQYMYNQNVVNPAYAGSKGTLSLGLLARTQWQGFSGAPQTYTLAVHSPVGEEIGLGLSIIHDEIGPVKEDNIYADFSYSIRFSKERFLAFGTKVGVTMLNVKAVEGLLPDEVLNEPIQKTSPNFGAGVFYYSSHFYAGFSIPNFLKSRHLETKDGVETSASEQMHYFFTSGYVFDINKNLKLKPSTMIKATSGAPLSVDISANALYNDKFELGLNYRIDDSFSALIGFQINDEMRLGYAYDYTTSNLGKFNSGSHEIILTYDFKIMKSRLKSPRYF